MSFLLPDTADLGGQWAPPARRMSVASTVHGGGGGGAASTLRSRGPPALMLPDIGFE